MSRPVEYSDLEPEEQEALRPAIERAGGQVAAARARRSAAARTRLDTGADFEGAVDALHRLWEFQHWGRVRRNNPPVKWIKGKPRVVGAADVDRTGWVRVVERDGVWTGIGPDEKRQLADYTRGIIPVAFDNKVLGMGAATYQHDRDLQHQLHSLMDAARAGEYAFLLVLARQVGLVFALQIQQHFPALLSGAGVKLFDRRDSRADWVGFTEIPHVAYGPEWSYLPLLRHMEPR